MLPKPFSQHLEEWLKSSKPKTFQGLVDHFSEKSFAILFLILMAVPALPLPTGGVTHIFEIIAILLALELIAGRRYVWLPKRWQSRTIPSKMLSSTLPFLVRWIRKLERISKPRLSILLKNNLSVRLIGLVVFALTTFAFLAPPFSGLDTLPSLGVVLMSLAMLLDDFLVFIMGLIVGAIGVGLIIAIGEVVLKLI